LNPKLDFNSDRSIKIRFNKIDTIVGTGGGLGIMDWKIQKDFNKSLD
jgi:hypothetical protein